jgi:hypothetical protein
MMRKIMTDVVLKLVDACGMGYARFTKHFGKITAQPSFRDSRHFFKKSGILGLFVFICQIGWYAECLAIDHDDRSDQKIANNPPDGGRPSRFPDLVGCTNNYQGPVILGWCNRGYFYGPVYAGSVVVTGVENGFYGLLQASLLAVHLGGNDTQRREDSMYTFGQFGLLSLSENFYGFTQFAAIIGISKKFSGILKLGTAYSGVDEFTGGFNISAGYSQARKRFTGIAQIGCIYNEAEEFNGMLMLGTVNVSNQIGGAQVGVVNISTTVRGVQLGIFNKAKIR